MLSAGMVLRDGAGVGVDTGLGTVEGRGAEEGVEIDETGGTGDGKVLAGPGAGAVVQANKPESAINPTASPIRIV